MLNNKRSAGGVGSAVRITLAAACSVAVGCSSDSGSSAAGCDAAADQGKSCTGGVLCDGAASCACDDGGHCIDDSLSRAMAKISTDNDDAEYWFDEDGVGEMYLDSSDLELVTDDGYVQIIGLRFANVQIEQGTNVKHAFLIFHSDDDDFDVSNGELSVTIGAEKVVDAAVYTDDDTTPTLNDRTELTEQQVAWQPQDWPATELYAGPETSTVNIAAVVTEVVGQPGWASGNAISILIRGALNEQAVRVAAAHEESPESATQLRVFW